MPKSVPLHRCRECGSTTPKWVGRCPECQAWGSVEATASVRSAGARPAATALVAATPAVPITEVDATAAAACTTGIGELDRVLGGGLVRGSVTLLAGEPGVGKSTLLLRVAGAWAELGRRCLVVTGEESAAQVRTRAQRIGAVHPGLFIAAETDLDTALAHVEQVAPSLLVVDSVQTLASAQVDGPAGGVTQVRAVAAEITAAAKRRGIATVLVGHVTKDGTVAGPRVLEHLVDAVLYFEGDRHSRLRLIRSVKNRFGPADEVGCFDLRDEGIVELPDPSGLFLSQLREPTPGTCVTVTAEGRRSLVAEVQALVAGTDGPPRRATSGVDAARLAMVLAVLDRRAGIGCGGRDVYCATVGGVRVVEPAADLAVAVAVASAAVDRPVDRGTVAVGEVGLSGEVRPVSGIDHRLAEAARLGFATVLVPAAAGPSALAGVGDGTRAVPVATVAEALQVAGILRGPRAEVRRLAR